MTTQYVFRHAAALTYDLPYDYTSVMHYGSGVSSLILPLLCDINEPPLGILRERGAGPVTPKGQGACCCRSANAELVQATKGSLYDI